MELWAGDVRGMATELAQLRAKVAELEEAIRWVVTQQADDLCWMDVYVRLGKLVGIEITLEQLAMLPKAKMLDNCERFICHLQTGVNYSPEGLAQENETLRAELSIWQDMAEKNLQITLERDAIGERPDEWWCWDHPMEPSLKKCSSLQEALLFMQQYMKVKYGEGRIDGSPGQSDGSSGKRSISS